MALHPMTSEAVMTAIDKAFEAQVSALFTVLVGNMVDSGMPGGDMTLDRATGMFANALGIAVDAHRRAIVVAGKIGT